MWLVPILALVIGFLAVYLPHVQIPIRYSGYIGLAVVAGVDSIVGALRAYFEGTFQERIFVPSFFTNAALAVLLLYLGEKLGISNVGVAIMVVLVFRIFTNMGFVRRYLIARLFEKRLTGEKAFPEP